MHLPFESVFTSYEACAKFVLALFIFPFMSNFSHNHPDPERIAHYNLMVKLPRWLFAIMLLFPSKYLNHKVEVFFFISECVFIILIVVFSVLSLQNIKLTESLQNSLPTYMFYFNLAMWVCAIIDSQIYEAKNKTTVR